MSSQGLPRADAAAKAKQDFIPKAQTSIGQPQQQQQPQAKRPSPTAVPLKAGIKPPSAAHAAAVARAQESAACTAKQAAAGTCPSSASAAKPSASIDTASGLLGAKKAGEDRRC